MQFIDQTIAGFLGVAHDAGHARQSLVRIVIVHGLLLSRDLNVWLNLLQFNVELVRSIEKSFQSLFIIPLEFVVARSLTIGLRQQPDYDSQSVSVFCLS